MNRRQSLKEILDEMGADPARFLKEVAADPSMPESLRRDAAKKIRQYYVKEETR